MNGVDAFGVGHPHQIIAEFFDIKSQKFIVFDAVGDKFVDFSGSRRGGIHPVDTGRFAFHAARTEGAGGTVHGVGVYQTQMADGCGIFEQFDVAVPFDIFAVIEIFDQLAFTMTSSSAIIKFLSFIISAFATLYPKN